MRTAEQGSEKFLKYFGEITVFSCFFKNLKIKKIQKKKKKKKRTELMCKFETFLSEEKENDIYMYEKNCNAQTQNKFQLSYFIQNINMSCIR